MSFSTLEAKVNASVLKHLANAQATIGANTFDGIFKDPFQLTGMGIGSADSRPSFCMATSGLPARPVGAAITIRSVAYTIGAHEPDGTGLSLLFLDEA